MDASEVVLLVENNPAVLDVTRRYLAKAGYRVLSASNPEEAIALCRDSTPDLLITDVVMPGINGPALAEHGCRLHLNLKVLFVSGYTETAVTGRGVCQLAHTFWRSRLRWERWPRGSAPSSTMAQTVADTLRAVRTRRVCCSPHRY